MCIGGCYVDVDGWVVLTLAYIEDVIGACSVFRVGGMLEVSFFGIYVFVFVIYPGFVVAMRDWLISLGSRARCSRLHPIGKICGDSWALKPWKRYLISPSVGAWCAEGNVQSKRRLGIRFGAPTCARPCARPCARA